MSTLIKVNRLKESYVSMFPGTLDHVKLITEHFGRILSLEPVVTEDDKIEYYISYEGDKNEVDEMEDFMKNVATNNVEPLVFELESINGYFKNRINFSLLNEVNNFDMESIDMACDYLKSIQNNVEALNKTLRSIQETFSLIALTEEANSK